MIKVYCDRCKKEESELEVYTIAVDGPRIRRWGDEYMYTVKSYHICPDCIKEVADFITAGNDDCQWK